MVVVTGPARRAVATLFSHAARALPHADVSEARIVQGHSEIVFVPSDELVRAPRTASIVLVDEAAALPLPQLQRLLTLYSRVVFSTTVNGYEGTGQGFVLRFQALLNSCCRSWYNHTDGLTEPIRWAAGDSTEQWLAELLFLDAKMAPHQAVCAVAAEELDIAVFGGQDLLDRPAFLTELLGLLKGAHYQNTPDDIRYPLDHTNVKVVVLCHGKHPVAAAQLSCEGGFDAALAEDVWHRRRRPKGHLLPQTLACQGGCRAVLRCRSVRVMRIVVHPAVQSRGVGSFLLEQAEQLATSWGHDFIGSSFGATTDLLRFWSKNRWATLHVGSTLNKSSGCYSTVVGKPLSVGGQEICQQLQGRFCALLPYRLRDGLNELDSQLVALLLRECRTAPLSPTERETLYGFAGQQRSYDSTLVELVRMAETLFPTLCEKLSAAERTLLVSKVLQSQSWAKACQRSGIAGKKMAERCLAQIVAQLLQWSSQKPEKTAEKTQQQGVRPA